MSVELSAVERSVLWALLEEEPQSWFELTAREELLQAERLDLERMLERRLLTEVLVELDRGEHWFCLYKLRDRAEIERLLGMTITQPGQLSRPSPLAAEH